MSAVEVVRVKIERAELTAARVPALRALYGLERLPLARADVEIEIKGVPTAVVNALRRVAMDEMPGRILRVPEGGFDTVATTERVFLPQFVEGRISNIALRPQIADDVVAKLRLKLDVHNPSASNLTVYARDLEAAEGEMPSPPLFNPTTAIAVLEPGKRMVIRGIHISTGRGCDDGRYNVACRGVCRPLDLEQHGDAEMREEGGAACDLSGFKVSSLVANPRHHLVTASIPAATENLAEVRATFADACANIKERLRVIAAAIDHRAGAPAAGAPAAGALRGVQYTVIELEGGLHEGNLQVPGETHTIGGLLRRTVFELAPDVSNVAYEIVTQENRLVFSLRHTKDVTRIIAAAIRHSLATFDAIQRGIMEAPGAP